MLLIHDGLTLEGTIPARGPYQAVAFRYRPATSLEVYEFTRAKSDTAKQHLAATVALVSRKLVSWDVAGDDGETVPITAEVLARVPPHHLGRLLDHVTGYADEEQRDDLKN